MLKRLSLIVLLAVMGMTRLAAQVQFVDIVLADANASQTVTLTTGINYLRFVADRDAVLQFQAGWAVYVYNSDENGTDELSQLSSEVGANGRVFSISVTSGQTYYFRTNIVMDAFDMVIGYESSGMTETPITIAPSYSEGDTYITTGSNLEFVFDRRVTVEHNWLCYGEGDDQRLEIPSDYINATYFNQYYYSINLREMVEQLVNNGSLAEGQQFTVLLEGIADAADATTIYGTDGNYSITLVLGSMPATLQSVNPAEGSTIPNYYPADGSGDPIVLTFSEELDPECTPTIAITYGDVEVGSYGTGVSSYAISGANLVIDLSGNNFPETVLTSRGGETATVVSISVSGLRTVSGRPVQSNYASAGSTSISLSYTVAKEAIMFYYDFDPFSGTESLAGYDAILVWVSSPITYSGIRVDWSDNRGGARTRTFTPEEVSFAWSDDMYGYVAYVPLASISYGRNPVTVTVLDVVLANGDNVEISGTFNTDASTGISDIATNAADQPASVYTPAGTLVRQGKAGSVMQGLPTGLYIVNGQKVIVK